MDIVTLVGRGDISVCPFDFFSEVVKEFTKSLCIGWDIEYFKYTLNLELKVLKTLLVSRPDT